MRILQFVFLLSFAAFVLVVPYLIFNLMRGEENNQTLMIILAMIFVISAFFIIRKIIGLKKEKQ